MRATNIGELLVIAGAPFGALTPIEQVCALNVPQALMPWALGVGLSVARVHHRAQVAA